MQPEKTEIIVVAVAGTVLVLLLIGFLSGLFFIFQRRILHHNQEKAALHAKYAQEILQTQLEIQNATLQQISQELHDNIGQLLSVARINLNILENFQNLGEAEPYIVQTNELVAQLIQDVRALTRSFDGDFVKTFGLVENITHELARVGKTKRFLTEFDVTGHSGTLRYEDELVVFRIFQEVLNNCIKHSRASKIQVVAAYASDIFELSVSDDGQGFDINRVGTSFGQSGAGLRNIRRRAELIGGELVVQSSFGSGTNVHLTVPNRVGSEMTDLSKKS
ncbi:ATP-binding protein [Dyadobacter sp. CY261]|uniref:sensor histidine kinase n=1 Tax=Dyadobacter sp. CY261 TaxID=2907203 RepID=UPI001F2B589C|nr:ATP-binding protein [Dyadobacter sp. CY261]MCF0069496.1 ATP-binding protein [Dyadobacter sp. CY261]